MCRDRKEGKSERTSVEYHDHQVNQPSIFLRVDEVETSGMEYRHWRLYQIAISESSLVHFLCLSFDKLHSPAPDRAYTVRRYISPAKSP